MSVCLFLIPDVHLVCVLLQIALIVVFMHSVVRSIHRSVLNSSELPVLSPMHREKRDDGRDD